MSSRRPADVAPTDQPDPKRPRNDAPAAFDIAAIRAQIAAKKAQVENLHASESSRATPPASGPPQSTIPPDIASIRAQVAEKKAQMEGRTASNTVSSKPNTSTPSALPSKPAGPAAPPPATMDASIAERLAAAKARVEAMNSRMKNPYLSGSGSMPRAGAPAPAAVSSSINLHPLLANGTAQQQQQERNEKKKERDRYKTMAPKFSTVKANQSLAPSAAARPAPAPELNPYAAKVATNSAVPDDEGSRRSRKMHFSAPGKYVRQGDALRNEQKMDALRQRIADASRKAGLDSEFDTLERSLKVRCLSLADADNVASTSSRSRMVG